MNETAVLGPADDVRMWIEQESSIHLVAVDPNGDPVELAAHEAEAVIEALQQLLSRLREGDGERGD